MTTAGLDAGLNRAAGVVDTRQRLLDVAVALFIQHSFAGTSLQMIADELGFTKAAIYYHFRTRDELLIAVMEPMLHEIGAIVATAERQRTARSRADAMVSGYADFTARNRAVASVLAFDPSVTGLLQDHPQWRDVIDREMALLTGMEPGPGGVIKATAVLTGLAGAASTAVDPEEDALRLQLLEVGRRILGLRAPRKST
jgi:AcrR family transcriptional regulator